MTKNDVLVVMAEIAEDMTDEAARAREVGDPRLEGYFAAKAESWRMARTWVERIDSLDEPTDDDEAAA